MFTRYLRVSVLVAAILLLAGVGSAIAFDSFSKVAVDMGLNNVTALSVGGEGEYVQMDFALGETPWLPTVDQDGFPLPDGSYKYELRTIPEIDREAVAEAQRTGNDRLVRDIAQMEEQLMKVHSGSFQIVGGQIIEYIPDRDSD